MSLCCATDQGHKVDVENPFDSMLTIEIALKALD